MFEGQSVTNLSQYNTWKKLLDATVQELQGAAEKDTPATSEDYRQAEVLIIKKARQNSFSDDFNLLKA